MQKTLDFLEQNVQWFALGLGGIFLLWSCYHYIITPPASVKIGSEIVTPGDIANKTAGGPARELKEAMNNNTSIAIPSINVVDAFKSRMAAPQTALAVNILPAYAIDSKGSGSIIITEQGPHGDAGVHLAALPVLPKAQSESVISGLSVVRIPAPQNNNAPANARGGRAPAQQAADQVKDLAWDTAFFKIPAAAVKAAFSAPLNGKQIDPALYSTDILRVELQRQKAIGFEKDGTPKFPNGDIGVETVPSLKIYAAEMKPLPPETATIGQKAEYDEWAAQNDAMISTPPFYEVQSGTQWTPPEEANANANGASNAGDNTTTPGSTDNGGGAQPPDAGTQPAAPGTQPSSMLGSVPGVITVEGPPPMDPRYGRGRFGRGFRGRGMDPRFMPRGPQPGQAFGNNGGQGAGKFDPLTIQDDLRIWAHDESALPGQTYRYRIIYSMKNPIFGIANMADKQLVEKFAIPSPPSDWSSPVTVPATTKFWIATLGHDTVNFDVFQWKSGEWKKLPPGSSRFSPGDLVPGTNWTLVDVRGGDANTSRKDKYVLLTDDAGELARHALGEDSSNNEHQSMLNDTNPNNPNAQNANNPPTPPNPRYTPGSSRLRGFRGR